MVYHKLSLSNVTKKVSVSTSVPFYFFFYNIENSNWCCPGNNDMTFPKLSFSDR